MEGLFFDLVRPEEVPAAHEVEKIAFPPEEAASLPTFKARQSVAPRLFLGAYISTTPRTLIGYVNATLSSSYSLTTESMHKHEPTGTSICVHAVAVTNPHRRKGVASEMLKEYVRRFQDDPTVGGTRVDRILLICHNDLVALYSSVGFTWAGKSPVVHGPNEWFEMRMEIVPPHHPEPPQAPDAVPSDVLAALMNPSRNRPSGRLFSSFTSAQDLVSPSGENAFDILCPRPGCGSLILKAGVAKFQTGESIELEPPTHPPPAPLQPLPSRPAQIDWWLVMPSPMAFENISFSRPVPSSSSTATVPRIKLLSCAECDLGAFGWSKEGGCEFWLAAIRVGYR